jgi:c-di-GMP-binding flagellar brake protein YcgR
MNHQNLPKWINTPPLQSIFHEGGEVLLTPVQKKSPIKLRARIVAVQNGTLGLKLPEGWRNFLTLDAGAAVLLTRMYEGGLYQLRAEVVRTSCSEVPALVIRHEKMVNREQRRLFYRVVMQKPFIVSGIKTPEGEELRPQPAILNDISATGIGFTLSVFLPPETKFTAEEFLTPPLKEAADLAFAGRVVWCRSRRPFGFRLGAEFIHSSVQEQDNMARLVNRLQMLRLSKYYHILGDAGAK